MLRVECVSRHFGGVYALRNVTIDVREGELRAIIGSNGAGKSTLFNLIGGHLYADEGALLFRGERIDRLAPHERARLGISLVFQRARIFRGMTVRENVMVGAHARTRHGFLEAIVRSRRHRDEEREIRRAADEALERVGLGGKEDLAAEALPLGEQRAVQLARALCAQPSLMLLDEPASGLRSAERSRLASLIEDLRRTGLTLMLVEHDVQFVMRLADRVTVLELGRVLAEGTPEQVRRDERVIRAYLGESARR